MATGGTIRTGGSNPHQTVRARGSLMRAFGASQALVREQTASARPEEIVIATPVLREIVLVARLGDGGMLPPYIPTIDPGAILLEDGEPFALEDGDTLIEE